MLAAAALNLGSLLGAASFAADLPAGGKITFGSGSIQQTPSQLTIHQSTPQMALDWKSFNIGVDKSVQFVQPSANAAAINRVTGIDASVIAGRLHANGTVVLINPNGVLFTPTAEVNVGSLVASTLKTITNDLSSKQLMLEGDSKSAVINQGKITAANGGAVAFIAAQVKNLGEISAPGGRVTLAAAGKVRIDFGGPVDLEIEKGVLDAHVEQGGIIRAAGGRVLIAARTLNELMHTVVNHSGVTEAQSVREVNGEIVLDAGPNGALQVAGRLETTGKDVNQTGGAIKAFGKSILLKDTAVLDAQGISGGGKIFVGGGWQGEVIDGRPSAERVLIESGASLNASALTEGSGGMIVAWSDISNPRSLTAVAGTLQAKGGQ